MTMESPQSNSLPDLSDEAMLHLGLLLAHRPVEATWSQAVEASFEEAHR